MKRTTTLKFRHCAAGILLLTTAVCLSGCVRGSVLGPDPRTDGRIRISSAIDLPTKAPAQNSTALSGIRFLRKDLRGTGLPGSYYGVTAFGGTRAANGNITFDVKQYYDQDDYNAFFVAYWPQGTENQGNTNRWNIDGKTDILTTAEYSAGNQTKPLDGTGGANGNPMTFSHRLAQLEVVCKADPDADESITRAAWGNISRIELETYPTATFDYDTHLVTFGGTPVGIPLLKSDYQTAFAAMAVPGRNNAAVSAAGMFAPSTGELQLHITSEKLGETIIGVFLQDVIDKDFEAGLKHTVTLIFKAQEKKVEVQATKIEDWGQGNTAGDTEVDTP